MSEAAAPLDLTQFVNHTPGPWDIEEPEYDEDPFKILMGTRMHGMPGEDGYNGECLTIHREIEVGEGCMPCEDGCGECDDCRGFLEVSANAHLIAAAPALLAEVKRLRGLLKRAVHYVVALPQNKALRDEIDAALGEVPADA